ncbi:MAG: TIM-barrel domain-containing protein, partial [Anaerolineae bacterium]
MTFGTLLDHLSRLSLGATSGAASYPWRKAWAEASWTLAGQPRHGLGRWRGYLQSLTGHSPRWPRTWITPGAVQYIRPEANGATLETEQATIEVRFLAPDLVRVRFRPRDAAGPREPLPYAIAKPADDWPTPPIVHLQTADAYLLVTEDLVVGVRLDTAQCFYATPDGDLLRADIETGWAEEGALRHIVALTEGERLYGLGERATPWNRRGRTHVLWNTDPAGYVSGDDPIDLNIPVYVGVVPNAGPNPSTYLVFYENANYAEFDLGATASEEAEHRFVGGELRYYLAAGPLPRLIERYTELTGRHEMQPLWMLGYQQSRWSYETEERVRQLAADFKQHQVPCDAIHLDIDYMDGYRCFTWDSESFPRPSEMAKDLKKQGIKLIGIIDPGIKQGHGYAVYQQGVRRRVFCRTPDDRIFHAPVWPGNCAFPDFTNPDTREWWGELYAPLLESGLAGFWNDMNEPAVFTPTGDPTLPQTLRHALEGVGGNHREAHNVYGMQMVRATRDGLRALKPNARPVVITRSGWAGVQRYATSWTGDNESTWDSLRLTIPMVLGLGLSGLGFTGADVGGFAGTAEGELFTRWIQMAAFMPFFRSHTARGTPDQEPWSYGEPFLSIVKRFIELRYELLPYLYTALWQMCARGWPVVRPLAWVDAANPALWDVDDAFLCGDALLVAPIVEPDAERRQVRLPAGGWYEFWTGRYHSGDQVVTQYASLETMPLLIREGTVLTMGESGQSVEQRKTKFLRLGLYPFRTPGSACSELYEDAGEGVDYLNGAYRVSHFHLEQSKTTLSLAWIREGAFEPPYEHIELTINGLDRAPRAVTADGETYPILQADPVRRSVVMA